MYLGDFVAGATVDFKWNTISYASGSVTRSTDGSIRIYKANSATQRTSANGITDTEDFDSLTGLHHCRIDLSDNTDAGFYAAGSDYQVVIQGMVIDGATVNAVLATFSIENRNDKADVREWIGTAVATPTTAGVPEVDVTHVSGAAQTAGDIIADTNDIQTRLPAALVGGRMDASVGAMAANTLTAAATAADFGAEIGTAVWAETTRTLTALDEDATTLDLDAAIRAAVGLASANLDTQLDALPTAAENTTAVWAAGTRTLTAIDEDSTTLDLDATIRAAVGMASANLDTQLTAIDDYLDTELAAVKTKTDQLTFTVAGVLDANVQYVNDVEVTGTGAAGDEWGP